MPAPPANVFNDVATLYDEVRPGYPPAIVEATIAGAGLPPGGRILEIGCGTGQITLPFARHGYTILALEPGDALAALAARRCRAYPNIAILQQSFEAWPAREKAYDLVLSAQAFHWIAPDFGCDKAATVLKPGGAIALVWNLDVSQGTPFWRATQAIYDAHFRGTPGEPISLSLDERARACGEAIRRCGAFGNLQEVSHAWGQTYRGADYLKLLRTYSDHCMLPEPRKTQFFRAIEDVVGRFGVVHRRYETLLLLARRK